MVPVSGATSSGELGPFPPARGSIRVVQAADSGGTRSRQGPDDRRSLRASEVARRGHQRRNRAARRPTLKGRPGADLHPAFAALVPGPPFRASRSAISAVPVGVL